MRTSAIVIAALILSVGAVRAASPPRVGFGIPAILPGSVGSVLPAVFDATGDGRNDVVLAPYGSVATGLRVFPGVGDGTFGDVQNVPATTSYVFCMAHGRLNGDAVDDIVLGKLQRSSIEVLLSDGAGGYTSKMYDSTPAGHGEFATILDWDLDGDLDVFTAADSATNFVRLNDGTGEFAAPSVVSSIPGLSPASNTHPLAADLDGDGRTDIAFAGTLAGSMSVSVFWHQADGSFAAGPSIAADFWRGSLAASDFDGDGFSDLAWSTSSSGKLVVVRHTSARQFATPVTLDGAGFNVWQFACADLNADSRAEIVTPIAFFVNNGDGTFAPARVLPKLAGATGFAVAAGDLDGNATPNVVTPFVIGPTGSLTSPAGNVLLVGVPGSQPKVTLVSPPALFHGTAADVEITGEEFASGATVDFGEGVAATLVGVQTSTLLHVHVDVSADAAPGVREVRVDNPDGGAATGQFTVLSGGQINLVSVTPNSAHAGETVDIVLSGFEFLDPLRASFFGPGFTVNSVSVEDGQTARLNVTLANFTVPGLRALTLDNGSGLVTEVPNAFIVLPARSLDLTQTRGSFRAGRQVARSAFSLKGTLAFNVLSPDGVFDPTTESAEVRVGDASQPLVIQIPADVGWKVRGGRSEWRSPKGAGGERLRLLLDFAKHTFLLEITGVAVTIPATGDVTLEMILGTEPGTSLRRWSAAKGGFALK